MFKLLKVKMEGLGRVFSYKLRYIVGFGLVGMATSTNRNDNTAPEIYSKGTITTVK